MTTLRQPLVQLGHAAVSTLYEQIKNLKLDTPLLAGDVLVIVRKWFSN